MDFVDDVNPVGAAKRGIFHIFPKFADIIDSSIRCAVYLNNINRIATTDFLATFALSAGIGGRSMVTLESLVETAGHCCLTHATHP